jgi:hypothetical protein
MIYYVDIDNTICNTVSNSYDLSLPIEENIKKINKLFDDGNVVIYWTARGGSSGVDWYVFTLNQLNKWGCKFNSLIMKKPSYDVIIDDRAIKIEDL